MRLCYEQSKQGGGGVRPGAHMLPIHGVSCVSWVEWSVYRTAGKPVSTNGPVVFPVHSALCRRHSECLTSQFSQAYQVFYLAYKNH